MNFNLIGFFVLSAALTILVACVIWWQNRKNN